MKTCISPQGTAAAVQRELQLCSRAPGQAAAGKHAREMSRQGGATGQPPPSEQNAVVLFLISNYEDALRRRHFFLAN